MKVLFAAEDPGGRNAIAPVIKALRAEGAEVGEQIAEPDIFIFGTSAADSRDKHIISKLGRIPSIAVLDFWANYWQRFSTPGKKDLAFLPTRICVMDEIAKKEMIAEGFPPERLVVTGNPHFDHFADTIAREGEEAGRILFISQPIRALANMPGYTLMPHDEYAALEDIVEVLQGMPEQFYISLRLHPKESADKFAEYLGPRVRRASEPMLEESLSKSGLIVGIFSPVLMQAAAAGKKVLSYEPDLTGSDLLVSNRVGVTTRVESKGALAHALAEYAQDRWPFTTRSLREVWPAGATERVVQEIHALVQTI